MSLPSRGAWIEILYVYDRSYNQKRRSPHGERGLKSFPRASAGVFRESLPSRGAWIEILNAKAEVTILESRSPHGERGLKSYPYILTCQDPESLPSRGAWIEISPHSRIPGRCLVAPLTGSVD